ncbi:MAG: MATE family efflux transporter [Blautia sp.]|nr:MATE family efflux transporter [Blautia sp.]
MERDLTKGSPAKVLLSFTIPVFLGNIFQQMYNMADTVIVGKFVGPQALAAVGSTGTIMFLIVTSLVGMSTGFTVMTAQYFGAGDEQGVRKTVTMAVLLSLVISGFVTVISLAGMRSLLRLMSTPEDIFEDAYRYIMIICAGIVAQVFYNLLSSILRALGNSRIPLYFLTMASALNIVLDLILIIFFHMGTAGAAYATVIAQGVSGLSCLVYIMKKVPVLKMSRKDWNMDWSLVKLQLRVGLPMAFQFSITAIGTMLVQTAFNTLGSTIVAAYAAGVKIEQLVTLPFLALGTAMATYTAQNTGAGKIKRVRQGFRTASWMSFLYAVVSGIFVVTVGKYMIYLFLSGDLTEIMQAVDLYFKCIGPFFIPLAVIYIFRNGIQGMGYGVLPMMSGMAELVGRVVCAAIASRYGSYFGMCMASPLAWVLAAGLLIGMYIYIMKKKMVTVQSHADL